MRTLGRAAGGHAGRGHATVASAADEQRRRRRPPDRLYFRQLLAGRDIARTDPLARQMVNFVYLIGDRATGEAVVVDAAYDVRGVLDVAAADGMKVTGALATHYHPDHVGGDMMGHQISGVRELLTLNPVPSTCSATRRRGCSGSPAAATPTSCCTTAATWCRWATCASSSSTRRGTRPGSQCFFVDGRYLVSGDTLFLEGCGRTDLPGGDPRSCTRA